ncbi:response regulator transcription factor [Amycolatopsis sp. NPDC021455]|uniref:response regulator transcription factor n=1 Tax=Amycolatopsis sp. NPDC021455 TaxID=3154901 RepID=UPI0033EBD5B8
MRVAIVEDEPLFLDALATSLAGQHVDVVGRARDADEALAVIDRTAPDVALLDIRLPPGFTDEGLRLAERVRATYPSVGLLVLSSYAEAAYAERLLGIEQGTGAVGYLLKERVGDVAELLDALHRVAAGDVVVDPYVITRLMSRRRRHDPLAALTAHERRVLSLVAEGRSNLGIAQETGCRITTVEKHLTAITGKLGLTQVADRRSVNVRVLATLEYLRNTE